MGEGRRPQGLTRLRLATLNSMRGLRHCYRSEAAFRRFFKRMEGIGPGKARSGGDDTDP